MLLPETQFESQLSHHTILKMTAMISDNLSRNTKTSNNLVEKKKSCSLTIIPKSRHSLDPLRKVVYCYDNVLVTFCRRRVTSSIIHTPLCKGSDSNDWKKRSWMSAHFSSIHLTRMTLLDRFNTIFENRGPEVASTQNLLGCSKP